MSRNLFNDSEALATITTAPNAVTIPSPGQPALRL